MQFKSDIIEGRRSEYKKAIAFLQITELDDDDLTYKLTSICNSVDKQLAITAEKEHNSAHFGSLNDAFGYQLPPPSYQLGEAAPAKTGAIQGLIEGLRTHLSADPAVGEQALEAVETALMSAATKTGFATSAVNLDTLRATAL